MSTESSKNSRMARTLRKQRPLPDQVKVRTSILLDKSIIEKIDKLNADGFNCSRSSSIIKILEEFFERPKILKWDDSKIKYGELIAPLSFSNLFYIINVRPNSSALLFYNGEEAQDIGNYKDVLTAKREANKHLNELIKNITKKRK